ncbi:MAG: M28 family peptidase [Thermoleophilia bacterium]|nr:M28 family peptidase [Thermoleophilia bacterium]
MVNQHGSVQPVWVPRGGAGRALRIAFIVPPLLAFMILLVSVRTPAGPSATLTVAPSFDGIHAAAYARELAELAPDRAPGTLTAKQAADKVAGSLAEASGETVQRSSFRAPGARGVDVTMENLWVVESGVSDEAVVVLANRDDVTPGPGLNDNATGTAAIVELARDLSGVERARTLVLASTDGGTVGQAGNQHLLNQLYAAGLRPVAVVSLAAIGSGTDVLPIRFAGLGGVRTPETLLRGLEESIASQPAAGEASPASPIAQVLDLIAPVTPAGAQVPFLDAGIAAIQLGDGDGGVGVAAIDEGRLGAVGAAVGTLLVRLDAEPRPSPPSGVYVAVSGRVIPGRAIALLAIALLVGPLFAAGRVLLRGRPSRAGWSAALIVAAIGTVPGIATVLIARATDLAGAIDTPPGSGWPRAGLVAVLLVIAAGVITVALAVYLLRYRFRAPLPLVAAPVIGLGAAVLLLAGSPASVLIAVPALWVWALIARPVAFVPRAVWSLGPVATIGLLIFLLRGADLATLVGAAGTGSLPAALVVGGSVLVGAAVVGALASEA